PLCSGTTIKSGSSHTCRARSHQATREEASLLASHDRHLCVCGYSCWYAPEEGTGTIHPITAAKSSRKSTGNTPDRSLSATGDDAILAGLDADRPRAGTEPGTAIIARLGTTAIARWMDRCRTHDGR